jgi:hypothetical protein
MDDLMRKMGKSMGRQGMGTGDRHGMRMGDHREFAMNMGDFKDLKHGIILFFYY